MNEWVNAGEHKRHLSKTLKHLTDPKHLYGSVHFKCRVFLSWVNLNKQNLLDLKKKKEKKKEKNM